MRSVRSVKSVKNVKNVTGKMLAVFAMGAAVSGSALADASDLVLRYDKPGAKWTEALVLGNGRLGGMVWGGVEKERIQLNEDTLWSGEPRVLQRADTLAALPEIRKLLLEGKTKAAADLVNQKMLGPWNQSYMPLGDLLVEFDAPGAPAGDYRRELDLRQGIARVTYPLRRRHLHARGVRQFSGPGDRDAPYLRPTREDQLHGQARQPDPTQDNSRGGPLGADRQVPKARGAQLSGGRAQPRGL